MGRMHAPGKGISQSALPYRRYMDHHDGVFCPRTYVDQAIAVYAIAWGI